MEKKKDILAHKINKVITLVHEKAVIDASENWCKGSSTYFDGIKEEIDEVQKELKKNRKVYLEDELGDVLWDYLNLLKNLDKENRIEFEKVFERCHKKYSERLTGRKNGELWNDVKKRQKIELIHEQDKLT